MSNRRTPDTAPLTAIELVARRWGELGDIMDGVQGDLPLTATKAVYRQHDAARDFVLCNEATTATEAALQAIMLWTELDCLDVSMPITGEQYEATMARLAHAAESVAKFLVTAADSRFTEIAKGHGDLSPSWLRMPDPMKPNEAAK